MRLNGMPSSVNIYLDLTNYVEIFHRAIGHKIEWNTNLERKLKNQKEEEEKCYHDLIFRVNKKNNQAKKKK